MLFVAFAIAAPAAAQQAAPPADDADIVVTGEREEAIRAFVGALTQVPQTGQIPRFED